MIKRLAIIPARSGSVRIKNKNIKLFNKKPVIYYTLEICKKFHTWGPQIVVINNVYKDILLNSLI